MIPATEPDRGSQTLEMAILAPALLLVIGLLIVAGRLTLTGNTVEQAAQSAARAASITRTQSAATGAARSSALTSIREQNLPCTNASVAVHATGFNTGIGQAGKVVVTVACTAELSDIALKGLPGSKTIHRTAQSPIDPWRER